MKKIRRFFSIGLLILAVAMTSLTYPGSITEPMKVEAAAKVKLNKKQITIKEKGVYQLKLTGTKKKVTWKSSKKSVATVSAKGKVTAKKAGKATITAKVGKKKYTCKVTVKKQSKADKEKAAVLKLINKERKKEGLSSLKMNNTKLNAAADARAKEIAKSFSHTRPNGKSCFSIIQSGKYKVVYYMAGENIAAGYGGGSICYECLDEFTGTSCKYIKSGI